MQTNAVMDNPKRIYRILIIEDNKDLSALLCTIFSMFGHEAHAAYDGIEGIEKAKKFKPEIIFCDIGLPGMNGYEVVWVIRKNNELKNVFLVAMTGYASDSDAEQARENGFDRHLGKPVDMGILQKVLNEYNR